MSSLVGPGPLYVARPTYRHSSIFSACLCCFIPQRCATSRRHGGRHIETQVIHSIQNGDDDRTAQLLSMLLWLEKVKVVSKRQQLKPFHFLRGGTLNLQAADSVHSNGKALCTFSQETGFVVWVMDCQQWHILPLLHRHGLDPNRPVICKRYSSGFYSSDTKGVYPVSTYKKLWTKGTYTYQSALDYYFASIYESLGEGFRGSIRNRVAGPLIYHFRELPSLLSTGVINVHHIDSVIVFNLLAASFNAFLSHYPVRTAALFPPDLVESILNEYHAMDLQGGKKSPDCFAEENGPGVVDPRVRLLSPDIPQNDDVEGDECVELAVMRTMIQHGFSNFEFLEFISPNHAWFGMLLCLLCHPKLYLYSSSNSTHQCHTSESSTDIDINQSSPAHDTSNFYDSISHRPKCRPHIPRIFSHAATLVINIISVPSTFPSLSEFEENLDQLDIRKHYTKRYLDHRAIFHTRLHLLRQQCLAVRHTPLSLKIIVRNRIRQILGGNGFHRKVLALGLSLELSQFLTYIRADHVRRLNCFPSTLVDLSAGDNPFSEINPQLIIIPSVNSIFLTGENNITQINSESLSRSEPRLTSWDSYGGEIGEICEGPNALSTSLLPGIRDQVDETVC